MNSILIGMVAGCPDCVNGRCISGRRAQKWIANGRNDVGYAKHDRTPGAGRAVAGDNAGHEGDDEVDVQDDGHVH